MKLKVNMDFVDKYTGERYEADTTIEVSEERGNEMLSDHRKLVSEVKESRRKYKR